MFSAALNSSDLSIRILQENKMNQSTQKELTRKDLQLLLSLYSPESSKYQEIDRALKHSLLPFYVDQKSLKKYNLIQERLLGGGIGFGKDVPTSLDVKLKNGLCFTLDRDNNWDFSATLQMSEKPIQVNTIMINGISISNMEKSDRKQLIDILQNTELSLLNGRYDSETNTIYITSRSESKMIQNSSTNILMKRYDLIEDLDNDYVDCAMEGDKQQTETKINEFVEKYEEILKESEWAEERIDVMIRKATLEGLRVALIPSHRYDLLSKNSQKMISQFNAIDQEIRILNLSLDTKEALDFHMYRGFVYSKLPASMYQEQRKIAVSDAMIIIHSIDKLITNKQIQLSGIFYKKMAHAFLVFAKGVDNPPASLKFISLGLEFVKIAKQKMINDPRLPQLEKTLLLRQEEFKKSLVEINLDNLVTKQEEKLQPNETISQSINQTIDHNEQFQNIINSDVSGKIEENVDKMEKFDRILFRTFQDLNDQNQIPANLKIAINSLEEHKREVKNDSILLFRTELRSLFLSNYLNYLINYQNIDQFVNTFNDIVKKFEDLGKKIPDTLLCKAEMHGFRGCVLILYPRLKGTNQHYDCAIQDFNELCKIKVDIHHDIIAFQYMMYGQQMLNYDPVNAVKLLRQAVNLASCDTVKIGSQTLLDNFFQVFKPINSSIAFNVKNMIEFSKEDK